MNLAVHHMMGAALFSKRVREIEEQNKGQPFGPFFSEIIWNASAATFLTVAAIEAYINEIFLSANTHFPSKIAQVVDGRWKKIAHFQTLKKYQEALRLKGKEGIPKGCSIYQNIASLIEARNALIHFQPQWHDESRSHRRIANLLKGKFDTSPFMDQGASFFPDKCMTYGYVKWAIDTAMAFANEFSDRSGILNKFTKYNEKIDP